MAAASEAARYGGMMMDYVEKLARAIDESDDPLLVLSGAYIAQAVLDAIAATGCKVVAREPTAAMRSAFAAAYKSRESVSGICCAMHDAAPAAPEDGR
jgi:hypothetical protein